MREKRSSTFYKLLVSFGVIGITPVLILMIVLYYFNVLMPRRDMLESRQRALTQIKDEIDNHLLHFQQVFIEFTAWALVIGVLSVNLKLSFNLKV